MKHAVYRGSIVKVMHETEKTVTVVDDGEIFTIGRHLAKEVDENKYKEIENELLTAKIETRQVLERIGKLNEEYAKKNYALSSLLMDARRKELSIVSKLLKDSQSNCQK